ncbi:unnamed protein product [Cylicostephanus goldi]|uniref:Uncharacterized protein n=1 Tax=Cylicostephanus goldi TaxID=71465 RepID=A0A3P7MUP4_CYLGO|nr:unnamed protein product [Cylicostephanus goldi]
MDQEIFHLGGVKFWRTASGKLLRLDPASPHPLIVRDSIGELASSKPRLVRLANGRLARITKKRIPASLLHQRTASVANSNQFHASIQRFPVPSATASVAVSDAIDASSLMGNGEESTELFEVQKKEPTPAIKAEPVDEKELEEQQEQPSLPPPTGEALNTLRPSLASALSDVNTAPTNVVCYLYAV